MNAIGTDVRRSARQGADTAATAGPRSGGAESLGARAFGNGTLTAGEPDLSEARLPRSSGGVSTVPAAAPDVDVVVERLLRPGGASLPPVPAGVRDSLLRAAPGADRPEATLAALAEHFLNPRADGETSEGYGRAANGRLGSAGALAGMAVAAGVAAGLEEAMREPTPEEKRRDEERKKEKEQQEDRDKLEKVKSDLFTAAVRAANARPGTEGPDEVARLRKLEAILSADLQAA